MMHTNSEMYVLDGLAGCTMLGFLHTLPYFRLGQMAPCFNIPPDNLTAWKFHALLLIGDPAYLLLDWLIKPFQDNGRLSREHHLFNYRLSRARIVVENALGRLKGHWHCLLKRNDASIVNVPDIVGACVTLHNLCEMQSNSFIDEWLYSDSIQTPNTTPASNYTVCNAHKASVIRNALVSYFVNTQNEQ